MGFKDDLESDMGVFFDLDEYAVSAIYTPNSGAPSYNIVGIFDDAYQAVDANSGAVVTSTQPKFKTSVSYIKNDGPDPGDMLTIGSVIYRIRDKQPDGKGIIDLFLTEID